MPPGRFEDVVERHLHVDEDRRSAEEEGDTAHHPRDGCGVGPRHCFEQLAHGVGHDRADEIAETVDDDLMGVARPEDTPRYQHRDDQQRGKGEDPEIGDGAGHQRARMDRPQTQ